MSFGFARELMCWSLSSGLVLLGIAAASANPVNYQTTRDTFMRLEDTTAGPFHGFASQSRVGKFTQDAYLADFDRAQIRNDIEAILGQPLTTAADLEDFRITWFVKASSTDFNTAATYRPTVYQSQGQDWNEATANRTQADTGMPWHNSSGNDVSNFFGGTRFPANDVFEAWGTPVGEFRPWELDADVALALLTNPNVVGMTFQHGINDNNGLIWSREAALDNRPFLQVEFLALPELAVPEPGTFAIWSLLGLAAAGLSYRRLRRRKH